MRRAKASSRPLSSITGSCSASLTRWSPASQMPNPTVNGQDRCGADEFRSGAAPCVGVCGRLAGGLRRSES